MRSFTRTTMLAFALLALASASFAMPKLAGYVPTVRVTAMLTAMDSTLVAIDVANPHADAGLRNAVAHQLASLHSRIADLNVAIAATDLSTLTAEELAEYDTLLVDLNSRLTTTTSLLSTRDFGSYTFSVDRTGVVLQQQQS